MEKESDLRRLEESTERKGAGPPAFLEEMKRLNKLHRNGDAEGAAAA